MDSSISTLGTYKRLRKEHSHVSKTKKDRIVQGVHAAARETLCAAVRPSVPSEPEGHWLQEVWLAAL